MSEETKTCRQCGKGLPLSRYYKRSDSSGKPVARCKSCLNDNVREREKTDPLYRERAWFFNNVRNIGLNPHELWPVFLAHSGLCDICGRPPRQRRKRLCVAHDHATGKFRGFICHGCNLMLGNAYDNPDTLVKGAAYLIEKRDNG